MAAWIHISARQASTRDEMQQRLRDMMVASGQPAAPLVAVGHPEQVSAAPSVVAAPAAFSVAIVPLQQVGAPGLPRKRLRGKSTIKAICTIQWGGIPWNGNS